MNELNFMHENISGIYNYCDRRCEKCTCTHRCLLFKQEAERKIKHILRDENKNDPDILAKDLKDDIQEAFEQTNKFMDEEDKQNEEFETDDFEYVDGEEIDFDKYYFEKEISDEERPSTFLQNINYPLVSLSEILLNDFYKYYDLLKLKFNIELEKKPQDALQQNLDALGWYIPLLNVKIRTSYWCKHKLSKSKSPEFAEIDEEILNVNSRIAFIAIENCITAMNFLYQLKPELHSETKSLLNIILQIRNIFIEEFPSALTYRRPYFD